ncbi:MAG: MBOAT family protein, partial [Clostridia bacterium]|nr:MBOAT family protein [Clostridia bacterium]
MVFSSNEFLFFFLPVILIVYYAVRKNRALSNTVLTVFSLLFYAWGEPAFVLIMLLSIFMNWLFALGIEKYRADGKKAKAILAGSCVMNVSLLGVFKYLSFVITNLNHAFSQNLPDPKLMLPIGISFFTFQAISYVADVYRGKGHAQKGFMGVCLYISFFPQLIAGPIVRYETFAAEIEGRRDTLVDFTSGVRRFLVGFVKKVLLANNLALIVD